MRIERIVGKTIEEYRVDFYEIRIIDNGLELFYALSPPELSEEEQQQLQQTLDDLAYMLPARDIMTPEVLTARLKEAGLSDKLIYLVNARVNGFDWLQPLIDDERLEDIFAPQGGVPVKVRHRDYKLIKTNLIPTEEEVHAMVRRLAYLGGREISIYNPVLDTAILPTGDRAALVLKSNVSQNSTFVVRKFPRDPWTPTKMIASGMVSPELMALLWLAVDLKKAVLIVGPMRSGKTSLANALLMLIPPDDSIVIVQDAPEMRVFHESLSTLSTTERVGFEKLTKLALRLSADHLVLNEVRVAEEARWWAQYVGTGHGGVTTIHADSVQAAFNRLKGYGVEEALAAEVKFAVFTALFAAERRQTGVKVQVRRVTDVFYIRGIRGWQIDAEKIFAYDADADRHVTGPGFSEALSYLEEVARERLGKEYRTRAEFLRLATEAGVYSARDFWKLYLEFRSNPAATMEKLQRQRIPELPVKPQTVVLSPDQLKYCPVCGTQLNAGRCPRCGWPSGGGGGETIGAP